MHTQSIIPANNDAISIEETIRTIYQLAKEKKAKALKAFLDSGICVNIINGENSAISLLAQEGERDAVWFLINRFGASKHQATVGAAKGGRWELMNELLAKGAKKFSAAYGAAYNADGKSELERLLSDSDEVATIYAVRGAAEGGHWDLMHQLINEEGASRNDAVIGAARRGDEGIVYALIDKGADIIYAVRGAAYGGHWDLMEQLIEKGADQQKSKNNAVYSAAVRGDDKRIDQLIENGANINFAAKGAAWGGHVKLFNALLARGASKDKAAYSATLNDNFVLTNQLVKEGADQTQVVQGAKIGGSLTEQNILYFISFIEDPELRKSLVEAVENKSADFNATEILKDAAACHALMQKRAIGFDQALEIIESEKQKPQGEVNETIQIICGLARNQNAEGLQASLDSGICVNIINGENSAISLLAQEGERDAVWFLINRFGASKHQATVGAAKGGRWKLMHALLDKGAGKFSAAYGAAYNTDGKSELAYLLNDSDKVATAYAVRGAAEGGHWGLMYQLIDEKGANQNDAVYGAALRGDEQIVYKLIDKGADIFFAARGAAYGGHWDLMYQLIEKGADQQKSKNNAVFGAACRGDEPIVDALIKNGASINSAARGAARGGHIKLVNALLARGASKDYATYSAAFADNFVLINQLVKAGADQKQVVEEAKEGGSLTEQNILYFISFIEDPALRKSLVEAVENKSAAFNATTILKDAAACHALMQKRAIGFDQALEIIESEKQKSQKEVNETIQIICGLARNQNAEGLQAFLDSGICVNIINGEDSAISLLAKEGETKAVWFLINRFGASKHQATVGAAKGSQWELMHALLAKGAGKFSAAYGAAYNADGKSELACLLNDSDKVATAYAARGAAAGGHWDLMHQLINEKGASRNDAVTGAAFRGDKGIVDTLIERGVNIHSAVLGAALGGKWDLMYQLIEKGADQETNKNYAVYGAACRGDEPIVDALIKNGADIDSAAKGAAWGGHVKLFNALLARGASKDNAAYSAAVKDNFVLINQLVKAGADQKQVVEGAKKSRYLTEQNILYFISFIEDPALRKSLVEAVENKSAAFNATTILKDAAACHALMQKRAIGFDQALEIIASEKKQAAFRNRIKPPVDREKSLSTTSDAISIANMMMGFIQNENEIGLKEFLLSDTDTKYQLGESSIALFLQNEKISLKEIMFLIQVLESFKTESEKKLSYNLLREALFSLACIGNQTFMTCLLMQTERMFSEKDFLNIKAMAVYGAAKGGHADIVNELVKDHPTLKAYALQGAARGGQRILMNAFLKDGVDAGYLIVGAEKAGYLTGENILSFISLIDDVALRERLIMNEVKAKTVNLAYLLKQAEIYHHYLTHTNLSFDEIKTSFTQWQTLEAQASYASSQEICDIRKLFHTLIEKINAHSFVSNIGKGLADGKIVTDTAYDIVALCKYALYVAPQQMDKMNEAFEKLVAIVGEAVKPTMMASFSSFSSLFGGVSLPGQRDPSTVELYKTLYEEVTQYQTQHTVTTTVGYETSGKKKKDMNNVREDEAAIYSL